MALQVLGMLRRLALWQTRGPTRTARAGSTGIALAHQHARQNCAQALHASPPVSKDHKSSAATGKVIKQGRQYCAQVSLPCCATGVCRGWRVPAVLQLSCSLQTAQPGTYLSATPCVPFGRWTVSHGKPGSMG